MQFHVSSNRSLSLSYLKSKSELVVLPPVIYLPGHYKLHSWAHSLLQIRAKNAIGVDLPSDVSSGKQTVVAQRCDRVFRVGVVKEIR